MSKTLYFDCSSGICGNMTLGALLEISGDEKYFLDEIAKLGIHGYKIEISKKDSYGISGTYVNVIVDGVDEYGHEHTVGHHHEHSHRNVHDICEIIDKSGLGQDVKSLAKDIFMRVAKAEAKVHNKDLSEVHFHEVGATDSIIDIVGTAILVCAIKPDCIYSSVVTEGCGYIECAHGKMSVPVPATSRIVADNNVRMKQTDIDTELVTPTGAAIIAALAEEYIPMPDMTIEKVGFGMGSKDIGLANSLKVFLGETEEDDGIYVMETNVDDSTGEQLAYTVEQLIEAGARDAFCTPIVMKKGRPAYKLEVICTEDKMEELSEIIFRETTTIGLRYRKLKRTELKREMIKVDTPYGPVICKRVTSPKGQVYTYPEYEDLKRIAREKGIAIKELYKLF